MSQSFQIDVGLPFVLSLAIRQTPRISPDFKYDDLKDELLVAVEGRWVPAIDSQNAGPVTKKRDIESGEDEKDRW